MSINLQAAVTTRGTIKMHALDLIETLFETCVDVHTFAKFEVLRNLYVI